jgi:4-hydroxy-tetrahydrodipicolinate synthase
VLGKEFAQMCRLVWSGNIEGAREIHYRVIPLVEALFCEPNPTAIKQALNWMGLPGGTLRSPLIELSPKGQEILRNAMMQLGKL